MMQTIDMLKTYMLNQQLHEQQRIGPGRNMYVYILSVYFYRLYDSSRPPECHCIIADLIPSQRLSCVCAGHCTSALLNFSAPSVAILLSHFNFGYNFVNFVVSEDIYELKVTVFWLKCIKISGVAVSSA